MTGFEDAQQVLNAQLSTDPIFSTNDFDQTILASLRIWRCRTLAELGKCWDGLVKATTKC